MNRYIYSVRYVDKNWGETCLTFMHEYGENECDALEIISERIKKSSFIGKVKELKLEDVQEVKEDE